MTSPAQLVVRVEELLDPLPLTVYVGGVPEKPPTIPGSTAIRPYVAVWPGIGGEPDEQPLARADLGPVRMPLTTTVAAASMEDLLLSASDVRAVLRFATTPGGGEIRPDEPVLSPGKDESVKPHRLFLPLNWIITTTH